MWRELIIGLNLAPADEVLLAGEDIDGIELPRGKGQRWSNGKLAVVTRGDLPSETATIDDTGLEGDRFDLVVLRDAAESHARLPGVLKEAYRNLKPGGGLLMTEFDAASLLEAPPQRYPQRLLSSVFPEVGDYLTARHPGSLDIAMELVRAGFKDADSYNLDFPLGHFRDYETHADFVAVDGWRGLGIIQPPQRESFLAELPSMMKSVAPAGVFDDVEPMTVARGYKPV